MFRIVFLSFFFLSFFLASPVVAKVNNFVSVVNPVRGIDFWEDKNQEPQDAVTGQIQILKKFNLPATWLLRFDALNDQKILSLIPDLDEKGIFLEITPSWTKAAKVEYHQSDSWHVAGSAFLAGYELSEREKLIDVVFEKYKSIFGVYPKSVGAWWIDSYSLSLMHEKYKINSALIVADQYTTDNYQIWGQYFSTPYYPAKNNALHPAQTIENKLPVVITQWASRDPVNSYGNGVAESTYSVQANDYIDFHNLDTNYFKKLVDVYTKQQFNKFSHLVVGLENSYSWAKYSKEYENQINTLTQLKNSGQINIVTMADFSSWYKTTFPQLSPEQIIISNDPLGSSKKSVWFMNAFYRAGWFFNQDGSVFRDIRQYIEGEDELCFKSKCNNVNFATSAIRVLDEVSFGHKLILDYGEIFDFKVDKAGDKYILTYKNEAGKQKVIEFLPRDIGVDGKISSIDTIILETTKHQLDKQTKSTFLNKGGFKWSFLSALFKIIKFLGFVILGCMVPGFIFINRFLPGEISKLQKSTLSVIIGFVFITIIFYLLNLVKAKPAIFIYLFINLLILVKMRKNLLSFSYKINKFNFLLMLLIGLGSAFQVIPTFRNGLHYPYGLGFWGPNTHDGVWHIALINQLMKDVPPENPIFAGQVLKNYHYFYDLLISLTNYITQIPLVDLLFRLYPLTLSLLLGMGTYFLIKAIYKGGENKLAFLFAIFLVYFSGSFGWIVEYIKFGHLGGESAFWANQSISFNLNPPFAISLIIVIAILQILPFARSKISLLVLTLLCGSLIAFKSYAAVLILLTLFIVGIFKKNKSYFLIFITSSLVSVLLFLSNFSLGKQLIIFSPFWFIHSMIDSPDRVGWTRLTLARIVGLETGNWFKFFASETISLVIFVIGNLGIRVFALLSFVKIKKIVGDYQTFFIFVFSILSLLIPILFIQAGNPWNTIQFLYYFLYTCAVAAGIIFAKIVVKLPKIVAVIVSVLFIILTPINSWATANGYLIYQPHAFVSTYESNALQFLRNQESGTVLTYPYDKNLKSKIAEPWPLFIYDSTAYVSAFSEKAVYIEDEPQNQILLTDNKKRLVSAQDFFLRPEEDFLKKNRIDYIYLPKTTNIRISETFVETIFENDETLIYKVK